MDGGSTLGKQALATSWSCPDKDGRVRLLRGTLIMQVPDLAKVSLSQKEAASGSGMSAPSTYWLF